MKEEDITLFVDEEHNEETSSDKSDKDSEKHRKKQRKMENAVYLNVVSTDGNNEHSKEGDVTRTTRNETNTASSWDDERQKPPRKKDRSKKPAFISIATSLQKIHTKSENENNPETHSGCSTKPVSAQCEVCSEKFQSRSKLFAHLKESGHAVLKSVSVPTPKKRIGKVKK